ncbi:MAG: hypothetical protein U0835_04765 [Isosphaeraceae bacterium]
MRRSISPLQAASAAGLVLAAACYGRSGADQEPPRVGPAEPDGHRGDPGRPVPARVYLLKDGKPFRLSQSTSCSP